MKFKVGDIVEWTQGKKWVRCGEIVSLRLTNGYKPREGFFAILGYDDNRIHIVRGDSLRKTIIKVQFT